MAKSIMQDTKECYISQSTVNLHEHHIFFGTGLRKISEKHGLKCYLAGRLHNQSPEGVHNGNRALDLRLKRDCQAKFEETHSHNEFMRLIGRNYL